MIYKIKILDRDIISHQPAHFHNAQFVVVKCGLVPILFGVTTKPWGLCTLSVENDVVYSTFDTNNPMLETWIKNILNRCWLYADGGLKNGELHINGVIFDTKDPGDGRKSIGDQIADQIAEGFLLDENYAHE